MFRIVGFGSPKFQAAFWTYIISSRKCLHLCQVGIFVMVILGLYISTFYYSADNDKMLPSPDLLNESSYTETSVLVNTESNNIIMQKQQASQMHSYERPVLYNETVTVIQHLRIGNISSNCGLLKQCNDDEFSVHLYTGKDHKDEPWICVDGKYILSKNINDGGRGINVVVIDTLMRMVVRVEHFDTYQKESTALETLLLTLRLGDIVILMTFDEPSRKLSRIARLLLFDLGSALVQNLSYRGSWYLITQKGLTGFSPYEDLHFVESNGWPQHHDVRFCVPYKIQGLVVHPDSPATSNLKRVQFCETNSDLPLFCDADVRNDPLSPFPIWKQPSAFNKIYDVPIIIMSGRNSQFLPLTLETLIRQPGIKPSLITVYHLPRNKIVGSLTDLFGFMSEELFDSSDFCEIVAESFERTNLLFPDATNILFIGENAILAPDFMFFMGQLLPILNLDNSLLGVSALNENGFKTVSSDPTLVYRSESFAAVAMLVRSNFFEKTWCINNLVIDPLLLSSHISGNVLVPDVSRVTLASPLSFRNSSADMSHVFFTHDRTVTFEQNIAIKSIEKLLLEEYEKELKMLISSSVSLDFDPKSLHLCFNSSKDFHQQLFRDLPFFINNSTNLASRFLAIYFFQETEKDISILQIITQCLDLFYHPLYPVRGMYKEVLRFMLLDYQVLLIGTKSPFFHIKSELVPVIKYNHQHQTLYSTLL